MLTRVITNSDGMVKYKSAEDEELDAALILSGRVSPEASGRYCFQTSYLNERYREYFEHPDHSIIWLLRNPFSVVCSMIYNWKRFALNELFLQCGYEHMDFRDRVRFQRFGLLGIPPIRRATYAYNGKISQVFQLIKHYPSDRLNILDYDDLILEKNRLLPILYERINLSYRPEYALSISKSSLQKKNHLKEAEKQLIDDVCIPMYRRVQDLVNLA